MDIQVEHIEGHIARLTVKLPADETQNARKQAARRLAKEIRIPGFRPGKAPYSIIASRLGDAAILEEIAEKNGNTIYGEALDQSEIDPVAPGSFVDISEEEGQLTLTFLIPKSAEVDLKSYRDIRLDLDIKEVTDEMVDRVIDNLRDQRAVVETVEREARIGDEVKAALRVTWWHEEDHDHDHDHADGDEHDHAHDHDHDEHDHADHAEGDGEEAHTHGHEHVLMDEEETTIILREADDERDVMPGFSAAVIGMKAGEGNDFSLEMPEDFEDENLAGQTVDVTLHVNEVHSRTLPALNDDFAAQAADDEDIKTLLELRIKVREDLTASARRIAEQNLFNQYLDKALAQAEIVYSEAEIESYIDDRMESMDNALRQQANVGLDDYLRITGSSREQMRSEAREDAIRMLQRDALIRQLVTQENIVISDDAVAQEIDKQIAGFGDQAEQFRQFFDTPQARAEIAGRLMTADLVKRVAEIATGEAPSLEEVAPESNQDAATEDAVESTAEEAVEPSEG